MKKKIAITGGIGSGKSMAASLIEGMGYPVFSCDEIYKKVLRSADYIQKIKEYFPAALSGGEIDRKKLAEIVFCDEEKRGTLNRLAHPLVMKNLKTKMEACKGELIFAEVPLLFEGNFEGEFDEILVIERDLASRIRSVQIRDGLDSNDVQKRIRAQFDYHSEEGQARMKNCHTRIIENDGSVERLLEKIEKFIQSVSKS